MIILGIGGILNDAACAILKDGKLMAAIEERKIARLDSLGELPLQSIRGCLEIAGVSAAEVDCVALVRPFAHGPETPLHLEIRERFPNSRLVAVEHHAAHAASAYYPSPFERAVVLTLDRIGDFRCGTRWQAAGTEMHAGNELFYPDSLGDLFSRVTELLGFRPNADEHKVQWLSTYGDGRFLGLFNDLFAFGSGDWPRFDRTFFDGDRISQGGFSARFYDALGLEDGAAVTPALAPHVAAGLQRSLEAAVLRMSREGEPVCLAGGLGMNALLVAALEREREVFVQPAAGNAGTALGAVLHAWHSVYRESGRVRLTDLCLGPSYSAEQIKQVLENCKLRFRYLLTIDETIETAVQQINDNQIVAWMQGRMEFGPRALGNRSILASPLNPYSTENLNQFIKHREPFRKFAASVPAELAGEYFETGPNARFLATVGRVKEKHRKTFSTAILGDDYVRVHAIHREDNPVYYRLLTEAGRTTGLPVLYNTSFNLFNDPLVCSPRDAARSFYSSGIDALFVGNFFLQK